jgi:phage I-like protein
MKLTCFRISNHALDGKALPSRIKVLSWGDNPSIKTINPKVTTRTISALPDFQRKRGRDRVALDYEHNTVPGTAEFDRTSEPRKVAAYGVVCVVEGDGLYLDDLLYTPSGIANAGEYIDLSVAANLDEKTGEVLGVHSVALTRAGAVEDVHFFSIEEPQQKGSHMDE